MKPIHRDDIPFEVVEQIERELKELYPDKKLSFIGDTGDPQQIAEAEELHRQFVERGKLSFKNGNCVDCGAIMPHYSEEREDDWAHLEDEDGIFMGWLCPTCHDPDGPPEVRPILLEEP